MSAAAVAASVTVRVSHPTPAAEEGQEKSKSRPAHHLNDSKSSFTNPWPSFKRSAPSMAEIRSLAAMTTKSLPQDIHVHIKSRTPDFGGLDKPSTDKIKSTWLGHACFLVELPAPAGAARGIRILFDPVFSHRCSPSQWVGPARFTPPPCKIEDIPLVDAIVISHNHYDHLDTHTIKTLTSLQHPHIFAPLGNESYFCSIGIPKTHAHCMDWWDERVVSVGLPSVGKEGGNVEAQAIITCTPAQHFTGRGIFDRLKSLWASWAVEHVTPLSSPSHASAPSSTESPDNTATIQQHQRAGPKVWFAGDTGYRSVANGENEDEVPVCPVFKEIGEKFGGFDFAMIPIGAYLPRSMMSPVHCAPQDSVLVYKDVKAKRALGMHWGAWVLTTEDVTEPPKRLADECQKVGIPDGAFGVCEIGETVTVSV